MELVADGLGFSAIADPLPLLEPSVPLPDDGFREPDVLALPACSWVYTVGLFGGPPSDGNIRPLLLDCRGRRAMGLGI